MRIKIVPALLISALPLTTAPTPTAHASVPARAAASPGSKVTARSGLLVDGDSGQRLWARSPGVRLPIGSITKVMTAVVVLRAGGLGRRVRIAADDVGYADARDGSRAYLHPGERFTVRELLNALLLPSGCDAAAALADKYGPGRVRFVRKMNRVARSLGMHGTRYRDVAGLPPAPGWSTAEDQVTLARYAMRFGELQHIVRRRSYTVQAGHGHGHHKWRSTDAMLGYYPGLTGLKSGHTTKSGYSFLFTARQDGRTLVGIVLNSSVAHDWARFDDATRLLDWGFDNPPSPTFTRNGDSPH